MRFYKKNGPSSFSRLSLLKQKQQMSQDTEPILVRKSRNRRLLCLLLVAGPCLVHSDLPVDGGILLTSSTTSSSAAAQSYHDDETTSKVVQHRSSNNNEDSNDEQRRLGSSEDDENDNSEDGSNDKDNDAEIDDDDFFKDEYVGTTTESNRNQDDDFYKFVGDPLPPRLFPLKQRDVIGFMLAMLGVTLGSSGGIGGGGLVVPCYIIAMGLPPRIAIPLGSVTVFGGSLAGVMLNLRRRHPLADRPIIDWDLVLVMEPLVLVGALLGAIMHRVVSEKILMVLLVLLLSVSAHTTLSKAKRMYDAELRYIEHLKAARSDYISRISSFRDAFRASDWSALAVPGEGADTKSLSPTPGSPVRERHDDDNNTHFHSPHRTQSMDSKIISPSASRLDDDEKQRILILNPDFITLRSDLMEQEKVTPRNKIIALMAKFSVLIFLNITLGGGAFNSPWGIQCGSVAFWVVHVIMVAFLISSAWAAQTYLVNRHEIKEIVRFDYVHGDIKWEPRTAVVYPTFFVGAGLCAGMFGIGGGMITVPLLLSMGVHPAVVSATASSMVFFTAALSTSSFAVFDLLLWDYAIVCLCVGFFASLVGQGIMKRARQSAAAGTGSNFERNSFIAYCIGCVIMLSALLMTMQYVLEITSYDNESTISGASRGEVGGLCEGYRYYNYA